MRNVDWLRFVMRTLAHITALLQTIAVRRYLCNALPAAVARRIGKPPQVNTEVSTLSA
jgi:hypothetical protein